MRQTLSVAICTLVLPVVLAIATRYVHPHWLLATLYSLQLHAILACSAAMVVAVILNRHLFCCLLLAACLLVAGHTIYLMREMAAVPSEAESREPGFRLMSFNILSDNFENGAAIAATMVKSGADVINVMEAGPLLAYLPELSATYPYRIGCGVMIIPCDQLMLSKTPLKNGSVRSLSKIFESRFILAETTIRGEPVTVAGIHTTKPYFDNFLAFELFRASLAINATQGPLVLSGDFNGSGLMPSLRAFLRQTDLRSAAYEPPTWPVRLGAFGMPIDHVYVRAPLKIKWLDRLSNALGSNHDGLIAEIVFTGK